jgi:hypothetical protein
VAGRRGSNLDGVRGALVQGNTITLLPDIADLGPQALLDQAPWIIQIAMSDRVPSDVVIEDNTLEGAYFGISALSQQGLTGLLIDDNRLDDVFAAISLNNGTQLDPPLTSKLSTGIDIRSNAITAQGFGILFRNLFVDSETQVTFQDVSICGNTIDAPSQVIVQEGVETLDFDASNGACPPSEPQTADDCRGGGFDAFGFSNQGQCIASLKANANAGK